jgi:hypothetical protein
VSKLCRNLIDCYEKTYSNSEEKWKSLFVLTTIFQRLSNEVVQKLNFQIDTSEQTNTMEYLKQKYDEQKKYR